MIILPPDFWVRVRRALGYVVLYCFVGVCCWWSYRFAKAIARTIKTADARVTAEFYARPNPEIHEQRYRYFTLRYQEITIDGQVYLIMTDDQNNITAICPKQK